ncbi:hypothetical protein BBK14_27450 [Parafrankia soli]|uniref:Uncharacterized protein n=1 Tax=Parafrankia soli TaxID=2599596 RepID=A0A1S1PGV9_9ACTN|nr:hypothetical protein [Parafrankia soli]OHV20950.1 hypothetical protein BBK14_27450 [Parafrankia soli]
MDPDAPLHRPAEYSRLTESVQIAGDVLARFSGALTELTRSWTDTPGHRYLEHYARPMAAELAEFARTSTDMDQAVGDINRIFAEQENEACSRRRRQDDRPRRSADAQDDRPQWWADVQDDGPRRSAGAQDE